MKEGRIPSRENLMSALTGERATASGAPGMPPDISVRVGGGPTAIRQALARLHDLSTVSPPTSPMTRCVSWLLSILLSLYRPSWLQDISNMTVSMTSRVSLSPPPPPPPPPPPTSSDPDNCQVQETQAPPKRQASHIPMIRCSMTFRFAAKTTPPLFPPPIHIHAHVGAAFLIQGPVQRNIPA